MVSNSFRISELTFSPRGLSRTHFAQVWSIFVLTLSQMVPWKPTLNKNNFSWKYLPSFWRIVLKNCYTLLQTFLLCLFHFKTRAYCLVWYRISFISDVSRSRLRHFKTQDFPCALFPCTLRTFSPAIESELESELKSESRKGSRQGANGRSKSKAVTIDILHS